MKYLLDVWTKVAVRQTDGTLLASHELRAWLKIITPSFFTESSSVSFFFFFFVFYPLSQLVLFLSTEADRRTKSLTDERPTSCCLYYTSHRRSLTPPDSSVSLPVLTLLQLCVPAVTTISAAVIFNLLFPSPWHLLLCLCHNSGFMLCWKHMYCMTRLWSRLWRAALQSHISVASTNKSISVFGWALTYNCVLIQPQAHVIIGTAF